MELQPFIIFHEHKHGTTDTYLVKCDFDLLEYFRSIWDAEYPEDAVEFLWKHFGIDFEPEYDEDISIDSIQDQFKVLTSDMLKSE